MHFNQFLDKFRKEYKHNFENDTCGVEKLQNGAVGQAKEELWDVETE